MGQKQLSHGDFLVKLKGLIDGTYQPPPPPTVNLEDITLFGGLEGVDLRGQHFVLAEGLELAPTYAHCFSHFMGAFVRPPSPRAVHPGPWYALRGGGVAFEIEAELRLDARARLGHLSRVDTLNLTTALVRLLSAATPRMPMVSNISFSEAAEAESEPNIFAWETLPFGRGSITNVTPDFAKCMQEGLPRAARLFAVAEFRRAFQLFDAVTWLPTTAAKLTAIWTAIETAMRPGRKNTAKTLARSLGAFIGRDRSERDRICNQVLTLYEQRGSSAHDSQHADFKTVRQSQMLARLMFIEIIGNEKMPVPLSV